MKHSLKVKIEAEVLLDEVQDKNEKDEENDGKEVDKGTEKKHDIEEIITKEESNETEEIDMSENETFSACQDQNKTEVTLDDVQIETVIHWMKSQ